MVMREYLLNWASSLVFFFGQQKPYQAVTSFIDAWVILSFRTDVASQETIIQRAILNIWIAPQNHKLLTWLHVVILKCKDGEMREKYWSREEFKWWNAKVTQTQKEHPVMRKMIKSETKCYSMGVFSLLTKSYFQNSAPWKNFLQPCGCWYYLECL